MYLRDLAASLVRRWPIVVIGFAVTLGLAVGVAFAVPALYVARTSMVLLPPPAVVGKDGNPYLYLGGLGQALDVLNRKLNSDEISDPIKKRYPKTEFTVSADTSTSGPILVVEATGATAAASRNVMGTVVDAAPSALESLQEELSVPAKSRITITTLAVDQEPTPDLKNRIQAVGAVGAVGVVLTLLLAVFVDGRLMARRSRRAGQQDEVVAEDTEQTRDHPSGTWSLGSLDGSEPEPLPDSPLPDSGGRPGGGRP